MVNKQIKWYPVTLPDNKFEEEMEGVYSCHSMRRVAFGEIMDEVYIFRRHNVLYKKVVNVIEIRWYAESAG